MKQAKRAVVLAAAGCVAIGASVVMGADWPQWRGANRDAIVSDFKAPATWPKELTAKWTTAVGQGVATPAIVGDKVYAFGRQGSQEVLSCLDAATGKAVWEDKYEATASVTGAAASFSGPRSSPAVAEGKVVTLDEVATVSCVDAASGKVAWRKDFSKDFARAVPQFYTSFSPLIVDGMAVVHIGGQGQGSVMALDLKNGEAKWKWDGEAPAYASPVVATIGGVKQIVTETERSVLGLDAGSGKVLWQVAFGGGGMGGGRGPGGPGGPGGGQGGRRGGPDGARPSAPGGAPGNLFQQEPPRRGQGGQAGGPGGQGGGRGGRGGGGGGGGRGYNAATPIVQGDMVIVTAPGQGTKALKIEKSGDAFAAKEVWANPEIATQFNTPVLKDGRIYGLSNQGNLFCLDATSGKTLWTNPDSIGERGFGSVVAAGDVIMALTPASELIVFKPSATSYEEVARIKVAKTPTHAYPVIAGKRIVIKDRDSVMLYEIAG